MPPSPSSDSARIVRRLRAALADLDHNAAVSATARLDVLYAFKEEITRRILEMEPPTEGPGGPASRWSPTRY
jgi:hypothetical protein